MPTPTRTLNPIHFEDLEPHRFEDLVRQLAYDFRTWRSLEATGRSGDDKGFDARGWEMLSTPSPTRDDESEDRSDDDPPTVSADRAWLIQCKRERSIGPKKLVGYLDSIESETLRQLHGVLFVAACDFSLKAREAYREKCRALGLAEWAIWGKAEIEDLLYRPANDHLLFAYFNISLQIRKRSLKASVAARLATKRKASRHLDSYQIVLVRDASEDRYPYRDEGTSPLRYSRGRWRMARVDAVHHDGLVLVLRESLGYLADDGAGWDYSEASDCDYPGWEQEPGISADEFRESQLARDDAWRRWSDLPQRNRGRVTVRALLAFEDILAIDENGDQGYDGPQLYTTEWPNDFAPFRYDWAELETEAPAGEDPRRIAPRLETNRVEVFARRRGGGA